MVAPRESQHCRLTQLAAGGARALGAADAFSALLQVRARMRLPLCALDARLRDLDMHCFLLKMPGLGARLIGAPAPALEHNVPTTHHPHSYLTASYLAHGDSFGGTWPITRNARGTRNAPGCRVKSSVVVGVYGTAQGIPDARAALATTPSRTTSMAKRNRSSLSPATICAAWAARRGNRSGGKPAKVL